MVFPAPGTEKFAPFGIEIRFFKLGNCVGDAGYSATTKGTITKDLKILTKTEIITWDSENEDSDKEVQIFEDEINIK